jgi:curli biogenesis system outer membrane secretion channel CsgG
MAVVLGLAAAAAPLTAQVGKKLRLSVADFDFQNVRQSAEELFGAGADVGKGLADLLSQQLPSCSRYDVATRTSLADASRSDPGAASQAVATAGADVVLTGKVLAYGKQEGQGPGVNVRVGRLGLGRLGKTVSVAFVSISVQFVGSGGSLAVPPVIAQGDAQGSGTSLLGEVDVAGLRTGGQINLSGKEFSNTTLGKATTKAMGSLCQQVSGMYDQVAAASAPAPAVAPAVAAAPAPSAPAVPSAPLPAAYGAPISGPFVWGLYQFKGTEHFRYDAVMTDNDKKEQGWYTLDARPGSGGNYQLSVAGQMGNDSFRSTTTVTPGQGIPLMQVAAMGPGAIILFSPVYMMFGGQQWQVGNEWSFNREGENASFKVESECSYAGVTGLRGVWRKDNVVMMDMCVSPNVALPLAVTMNDDNGKSSQQVTLVEFRP